jgi:predicted nucleic acid-binding protein
LKTYVLDANAVIRYLESGKDWEKVKALFARTADEDIKLFISVINWGEVLYTVAKKVGLSKAMATMKTLSTVLETVPAGEAETEAAVTLKHNFKLGYADSFAAALAIHKNGTLVTADPDFSKLGKRLKVIALARHAGARHTG